MKKAELIYIPVIIFMVTGLFSCISGNNEPQDLPILGERYFDGTDTIYHTVGDFSFFDQDSNTIDKSSFQGKVYVTDFFFINCPTICPKVKAQMKRVYDHFEGNEKLMFLSHSIDTKHDSIPALKKFAEKLEVESNRWKFVTGDKNEIYSIATDYFSVAKEDESAPGGYDHSGRLILVDENFMVRAFCDGTDAEDVDQFIIDIERLLNE